MNKNVLNTDLIGKVAVVTGAGGVLCGAFSKTLARAGAKVALLDLNEQAAIAVADEIIAEGGVAKAYKCNVLDKENCYKFFEKALELEGDNYKAYICYAIAKSEFKDYKEAFQL